MRKGEKLAGKTQRDNVVQQNRLHLVKLIQFSLQFNIKSKKMVEDNMRVTSVQACSASTVSIIQA
ncbi:hypothetical protein T4E_959 [Trichinella pseudospiralis]|uniref:Uncharacterized protein n=1 Tax=Trichinella pseudospiralis TaxID=6337 RepID=A0A0V0Y0B9_TRIPS|nr:hypothetical protein T4E_959 [Trichinella pseudospiralis]